MRKRISHYTEQNPEQRATPVHAHALTATAERADTTERRPRAQCEGRPSRPPLTDDSLRVRQLTRRSVTTALHSGATPMVLPPLRHADEIRRSSVPCLCCTAKHTPKNGTGTGDSISHSRWGLGEEGIMQVAQSGDWKAQTPSREELQAQEDKPRAIPAWLQLGSWKPCRPNSLRYFLSTKAMNSLRRLQRVNQNL